MNKIKNQDGELVVCVGSEDSHIRNKTEYNRTMRHLLNLMDDMMFRDDVSFIYNVNKVLDMWDIPKDRRVSLVRSALYYHNERAVFVNEACNWFFGLSDEDKISLKDTYYPDDEIEYDDKVGYCYTLGQICEMYRVIK